MHTLGPWCIWVCKFSVSAFGERLNNAQRDSKKEWMSVHLLLANFLCDLLHPTVPVTASCDTHTHTSQRRIQWWRVSRFSLMDLLCVVLLCVVLNPHFHSFFLMLTNIIRIEMKAIKAWERASLTHHCEIILKFGMFFGWSVLLPASWVYVLSLFICVFLCFLSYFTAPPSCVLSSFTLPPFVQSQSVLPSLCIWMSAPFFHCQSFLSWVPSSSSTCVLLWIICALRLIVELNSCEPYRHFPSLH